ncbi:MAG: AAA family ATPase [Deltaproteobacteria bacterium]|nr:AAA family ATPase [Deltaproteobacteria bacterium]
MIKCIIKIKNCPSFIDFKPASDLPEFKKYNLIYGWNGSGKTSFSRILRSFELGENYYNNPEKKSEFIFDLDNEISISHNELTTFKNIRVFNKDFIDDSVFGIGGPKPIFFLGKESKEDKEKIISIEDKLGKLRPNLSSKKSTLEKLKNNKQKILQDKARDIKNALTTTKKDNYRNYDRTNLVKAIEANAEKLKGSEGLKLSDDRLKVLQKSIQQTSEPPINSVSVPNFDLSELENEARNVLSKTITSQVIEKLQADEAVNKWVERGLQIHKDKSLEFCAFCEQKIPIRRLEDLENHFNDEYQRMIQSVKEMKMKCDSLKVVSHFPESSGFYDELVGEYQTDRKNAEKIIKSFNERLDSIITVLEKKERNPFSQPSLEDKEPLALDSFKKINEIINHHNQKTENFQNQIDQNKKELEDHYIAEFYPFYSENINEIKSLGNKCSDLEKNIKGKEDNIKRLKENLITHHIPAQQINNDLEAFLGRSDIQIMATESKDGYRITRNGEIAEDLSEGEKTALAIVYFLTKINEQDFDLQNSVVVIDDPVSSLDSNAIFQAFSFIKESIKEAGQIFILTHHFDFFRQVKNWFAHYKKAKREYFMIVCSMKPMPRKSSIIKIDKLLIDYESEYHFLFSVLYRLAIEEERHLEEMYPIPNIARKFLESFLAFRVPLGSKEPNIYQRLNRIVDFDPKKKERIRRFVETHSHPRYESGVLDFDMSILGETPDILNDLMDLVREEDEKHYNFLVESVTGQKPAP